MMKGLELSKQYYDQVILEFIHKKFPEYEDRIAAGLVGEGSECLGFDDEISRDHDWGVRICLWLCKADYENARGKIQAALEGLPGTFAGTPVLWMPGRSGVMETDAFFKKYLNVPRLPMTIGEWLAVPSHHLAVASDGMVFADPYGAFSETWEELRQGYPEDIRLKKLAYHCMMAGQAGQYNYPRLLRRGDVVGASLAKAAFVKDVMHLVYLLNNRYAPFYKWMHYGMRRLSVLGEPVAAVLEAMMLHGETVSAGASQDMIEEICSLLISEIRTQGLTDVPEGECYMVPHGESIHEHIEHEALRQTNPWAGGA